DIDVRVLLAAHAEPLDASGHLLAEDAPADPIDPDDIVGLDVLTVDAQAPALFGAHEEFLASARLDNLSSVHAEVQALITLARSDIDVRALLAAHAEPLDASGHLLAEDAPADPIDPDDIVGLDVLTVAAQAPALFGAHEEFLASARLDNLSSVHAEVQALITLA